jgi:hypothetical protein
VYSPPIFAIIFLMSKCILFIDGENLFHKVEEILKEEGIDKAAVDLASLDLNKLFREALKGFIISRKIFYAAALHLQIPIYSQP